MNELNKVSSSQLISDIFETTIIIDSKENRSKFFTAMNEIEHRLKLADEYREEIKEALEDFSRSGECFTSRLSNSVNNFPTKRK